MMLNGGRRSVHGYRCDFATTNGGKSMTLTLRDSVHLVSDPDHLDDSVREVFETMLGVECRRETGAETLSDDEAKATVTAVVGFGGILSGACASMRRSGCTPDCSAHGRNGIRHRRRHRERCRR